MKARTEELLYLLLWSVEGMMRPSLRNIDDSFEKWAYRSGLSRQLANLEKRKLIERESAAKTDRVYRLTQPGRLLALGGRDPQARWARPWDGLWRLVLYDLPVHERKERMRLRRYLHARGFGYLQNSVWITPDPLEDELQAMRGGKIDVEKFVLLQATPVAGETDAQIVTGAWDFALITRRYERYLDVLGRMPKEDIGSNHHAQGLRRWASIERSTWNEALRSDPLLPEKLLPARYLGKRAWQQRVKALQCAARALQRFAASA